MTLLTASLPLAAIATLLFVANIAFGQEYVERLRNPATVKGLIGGESHNSYVIRARKGQTLTVQISWRHEHHQEVGDNHAEFSVSDLPNFEGQVTFGKESNHGKRWSGRIPR